ncbi:MULTISPECIES: DctP family TRAP transporter solute-binding subunit [Marinobacter]|uniref:DctP family TRAP transporter solute-binding subunit n=1 Tax=Marinobacter TaxID=2742 RepID=UPI000DADD1BF|nr:MULTISPECIES: DctP family TRAP transporter solute-binding subunit [Marinobacter]
MKLTTTTMGLALSFALSMFSLPGHAADTEIELSFGHVDPQEWTTSKKGAAAKVFKDMVEGQTGGRIAVNVYPSSQLGGEMDMLQTAQEGVLSMVMASGSFTQLCPEASVLNIPYLFPSAPVAWDVLDGPFGQALSDHCLEETGLRILAYGETGFRNFTNSKRPVAEPKDLDGLKIRVMTTPLFVEMVRALGAEPTPIAWPEVPSALATGVVDGQENPIGTIYNMKFYQMQDYLTLDGHVYGTDFLVINDDLFQSLSAEDQRLVRNAARTAGLVGRAIQQVNSAEGLARLSDEGMTITTPTREQLGKFQQAAQPAVIEWLKGELDPAWITRVQDAVEQATAD